jgi:hypothetical protein
MTNVIQTAVVQLVVSDSLITNLITTSARKTKYVPTRTSADINFSFSVSDSRVAEGAAFFRKEWCLLGCYAVWLL